MGFTQARRSIGTLPIIPQDYGSPRHASHSSIALRNDHHFGLSFVIALMIRLIGNTASSDFISLFTAFIFGTGIIQ